MKVLILGAGWFGCHCANVLLKCGAEVKIGDIANDFFTGSSSKNQNRLHLGFHYPRSHATRIECVKGFEKFIETYNEFVYYIPNNLYCIDQKSIIDFESYKAIYKYEGTSFNDVEHLDLPFDLNEEMFDGVIRVPEAFINFRAAQSHFRKLLDSYMIRDYDSNLLMTKPLITYDGEQFDFLVDCTYSTINSDMYYENCVSFIYKYLGDLPDFSITVMDGKFWSLYLYDLANNLYTLTDVEFTPSGSEDKRIAVEEKIKCYVPDFEKCFEYQSCFISRKAKSMSGRADDRSLLWSRDGNVLKFSGGKITGIFSMEEVVMAELPELQKL